MAATDGGAVTRTVVILAAHAFEARAAASIGDRMTREPWGQWTLYRGRMWDWNLAILRSGPGKTAAAAATQAAIQHLDPAVLISFGVAGCPDPAVPTGSLVVATEVIDVALSELQSLRVPHIDRFEPDVRLAGSLLDVPGTQPATVLCWEGCVVSPIRMPPPQIVTNGLVVADWESAAVAQVATMWDLPWAALKVVSDHGERDRLRLVAMVAKRPLEWGAEAVRRACDTFISEQFQGREAGTQEVEV
jgi:adenosylhomocysteine nucleosidase